MFPLGDLLDDDLLASRSGLCCVNSSSTSISTIRQGSRTRKHFRLTISIYRPPMIRHLLQELLYENWYSVLHMSTEKDLAIKMKSRIRRRTQVAAKDIWANPIYICVLSCVNQDYRTPLIYGLLFRSGRCLSLPACLYMIQTCLWSLFIA